MNTKAVDVVGHDQLPAPVARRGITEAAWRTLANTLYPGAAPQSVLMVVDYCAARKLDPLKKPCHIVPMQVKDAKTGSYSWRDVVLPGIYEYRTTATRTGLYLGHSKPEYGEVREFCGTEAPEWCEMTVYRWSEAAKQKIEYPVRVYFRECAATKRDRSGGAVTLNDRWNRAPIQMLTKCTEAAGLREAFPDEIGGEPTADEMEGRTIDVQPKANPRDGMDTAEVEPADVEGLATRMRNILDADKEEDDIALAVFDLCREIETSGIEHRNELYLLAHDQLPAKLRTAWKTYRKLGEELARRPI